MAYEDGGKPSYPAGYFQGEGNVTREPRMIGRGDRPVAATSVACNYRDKRESEGTFYVDVICFGKQAENLVEAYENRGDAPLRLVFAGPAYGNFFKRDNGDEEHNLSINADTLAVSLRWSAAVPMAGGGSSSGRSSRRRDEDEDERGSSRSSRRSRDEEDEGSSRSSRRSSRSDDSEGEDDSPRRSRRESRVSRRGDDDD